ncbi:MAG: hypothetical protein HC906_04150 [Bacteroidales bacterium]|nr:hypothetical protein [Bacteroidales bacterium]
MKKFDLWLTEKKFEGKTVNFGTGKNIINKEISLDDLKSWQKIGYLSFLKNIELTTEDIYSFEKRKIKSKASEIFSQKEYSDKNANEEFAILTHHKSNKLFPSYIPQLTLGTVIQRFHEYYLCIQQRCDSNRLENNKSRRFLFLPLEESENDCSIIFKKFDNKYIKLKIRIKNCYDLFTLNFFATDNGSVVAKKFLELLLLL